MMKILQLKAIFCLLSLYCANVMAQTGTYQLNNKNGSYCSISFVKKGNNIEAEIFAWWNTKSAQTGSYHGKGLLLSGQCTLKSDENEPECTVTLALEKNEIRVVFKDCYGDNLPEDFNGMYRKMTNATAGDYVVTASRSYFHQKPDSSARLNSYVVKNNKVTLSIDRVEAGNTWVYVYYVNPNGEEISGYLSLSDLRKVEE